MSKEDRIAIVISILVILFGVPLLNAIGLKFLGSIFITLGAVAAYWGYRFIQNDISFYKVKERKK